MRILHLLVGMIIMYCVLAYPSSSPEEFAFACTMAAGNVVTALMPKE